MTGFSISEILKQVQDDKIHMRVANPIARLGEDIACDYLQKNHYTIVERNFHARGGEIDIIAIDTAEKESVLSFVEVKTRKSDAFGSPFEAISYWKLKALKKTAIYYTILHKNLPISLRMDAVGVTLSQSNAVIKVELLKNITE